MREYTVLVEWADGPTEDTDEIVVEAAGRGEAVALAIERWRDSVASWSACTLVKAWTLEEAIAAGPGLAEFDMESRPREGGKSHARQGVDSWGVA